MRSKNITPSVPQLPNGGGHSVLPVSCTFDWVHKSLGHMAYYGLGYTTWKTTEQNNGDYLDLLKWQRHKFQPIHINDIKYQGWRDDSVAKNACCSFEDLSSFLSTL